MTITVFIDGAAGTTGIDIQERLAARGDVELILLDDDRRKETAARAAALREADIAILCLPDDAARDAVALAGDSPVRVIDASSAHRVAPDWTYGLAELRAGQRERIAAARLVSNPGCYPTAFLAMVAPLVAAGLLPADHGYTINAVSGYSGGGKALIGRFEVNCAIAYRAYGYALDHKHVPEMQMHAGLAHPPLFAPAVVDAYRGMVLEVPLVRTSGSAIAPVDALRDCLHQHYNGSPLVSVGGVGDAGEVVLHRSDEASDRLTLDLFASADGNQIRMVATLDNLGKGAGGACVQNLNVMAGLPETAGLRL